MNTSGCKKFVIRNDFRPSEFVKIERSSDDYLYTDIFEATKFETIGQAIDSGGFVPGFNSIVETSASSKIENTTVAYPIPALACLFAEEFARSTSNGAWALTDIIKREELMMMLPPSITAPKVIIDVHRDELMKVVVERQQINPDFDAFWMHRNDNGIHLPAFVANEDLVTEIILKSSTQSVNYHTLDYSVEAAKALLHSLVVSSIGDSVNRFMEANKSCISDVNAFLVQVTESFIARS